MKAVMYHYVNEGGDSPPFGYYHLDRADFAAQLDYFESEYGILDRETFLEAVRSGGLADGGVPEGVVLTFDDGLSDHYNHVLPELRERDLWGIFYVPAGPYLDDEADGNPAITNCSVGERALDVHRIHSLLGACGGERVAAALNDVVDASMVDDEYVNEFGDVVYGCQVNETATERAKRLINYYVADDHRGAVLDAVESDLLGDPGYHDEVYMTRDEIATLADEGMLVGAHSVTHRVMSTLSVDEQRAEIESSFAFLEDVLGDLPVRTFCHPYGGSHSYTDETLTLLYGAGCLFSFDVKDRDITAEDLRSRPHRLPRFDCNEFKHGESTVDLG